MAYKAKATRNDDGSYGLSYGKGSKKLTGHLIHHSGGRWFVDAMPGNPAQWNGDTKREVIAAWEAWATSVYGGVSASATPQGDNDQTATTQRDVPPAPHSGPPTYKPSLNTGPAIECKSVVGLDGQRRLIGYSDEGSTVRKDDDDEPLPVLTHKGTPVQVGRDFEVCEQVPTPRFPYTDGFAVIEITTGTQVGWCKAKDRAVQSLNEHNTQETHESVAPPSSVPSRSGSHVGPPRYHRVAANPDATTPARPPDGDAGVAAGLPEEPQAATGEEPPAPAGDAEVS